MIRNTYLSLFIFTFYCVGFSSCAAISKSQKSAVEEFATSAKNYAELPKGLLDNYTECLYKFNQLEAVAITSPNLMVEKLNITSADYRKRDQFINEYTITYQLIEKYSKSLLEFVNVDVSNNLNENSASLGTSIDSLLSKSSNANIKLIPVGFGEIGAKMVQFIGQRRINNKQLKEARKFTAKGDTLIEKVSIVLKDLVLANILKGRLEGVRDQSKDQYLKFLSGLDSSTKSPDVLLSDLNPMYLEIKNCATEGLLLMEKVANATKKFQSAHKELMKTLNKKDSKLIIKDIALFTDQVNEIYDLVKIYNKKS